MKFTNRLSGKFNSGESNTLKSWYFWLKNLIFDVLTPPDHLKVESDPEPLQNRPFMFIEMFDDSNEFKSEYRMKECKYFAYRTAFPLDALEAPCPPTLSVSLNTLYMRGTFSFDFVSTSSTITFYGNGMAKHIMYESRGDFGEVSTKGGWYDRETSHALFSEFESFHFEEWKDDFTDGYMVYDGNEWSLTATYEDGRQKKAYGFLEWKEPANWYQIESYFGLSSDFHRIPLGIDQSFLDQPSPSKVDVKELSKFMLLYMGFPFFGLIVFLLWVWIYFETP